MTGAVHRRTRILRLVTDQTNILFSLRASAPPLSGMLSLLALSCVISCCAATDDPWPHRRLKATASACASSWTCRPTQVSSACEDSACTEAESTSLALNGGIGSVLSNNGKYEFRFAKFVSLQSRAIYTGYNSVTVAVKSCAFVGCKGERYYGSGGAIYIYYGGTATITSSSFRKNIGYWGNGGAIYGEGATLIILNCEFLANEGQNTGDGGAIMLLNCGGSMPTCDGRVGSSLTLKNCKFVDNKAAQGKRGNHILTQYSEFCITP